MPAFACQCGLQRLVCRDRCPRRLSPAELLRSLEPGPSPPFGLRAHPRRGLAERGGIAILNELPRGVDHLGNARVAKRDNRTPTSHRLEAWQPETLIPAWKDETSRGRVEIGQLRVV